MIALGRHAIAPTKHNRNKLLRGRPPCRWFEWLPLLTP
jgi:hypothetical protein